MTIRTDIDVEYNASPRVAEVDDTSSEIIMQDLVDTLRDQEESFKGMSFKKLLNASGKEDLGGGVSVGITVSLQNLLLAFEGRTSPAETGTVTGSPVSPISGRQIIQDTTALFEDANVERGSLVINFTDQSIADVITIDTQTQLTTKTLVNGITNTYQVDDIYHVFNIIQCNASGGNLVAVNEAQSAISSILPTAFTQIILTSSASATLQELGAIQYSSFAGGISIDVINGTTGTTFPIGTVENPVNNLLDALIIANSRGFKTIFIRESMTMDGGSDFRNFIVEGVSHVNTFVNITSNALCENVTFRNCNVSGVLDGGSHLEKCSVGDISYVNGHIHDCGLYGTVELAGSSDAVIVNSHLIDPNSEPIIDLGESGQNCIISDWSGDITLKNLTSSSNKITIQIDGGMITLDPTITAGYIEINGIGILIDNATGYDSLITDGLMNRELITKINWDVVNIDVDNGSSGTSFPIGTHSNPVDNWADALIISNNNHIESFHIHGILILTSSAEGLVFRSDSEYIGGINFNDQIITNSVFENLSITGNGTGGFNAENCQIISGMTGIFGGFGNCEFGGTFVLTAGEEMNCTNCASVDGIIFNLSGSASLAMGRADGIFAIANITSPASVVGITGNYHLTLDVSCIAGTVLVAGIGTFVNNSTMTIAINQTIPAVVWDETLADHTSLGTYGHEVATKADIAASSSTMESSIVSGSVIYGTETSGDYTSTASKDNTYWQITEDVTNGITVEMLFNLDNEDCKPGIFTVFGRYIGVPSTVHYLNLHAWNYETSSWEILTTNFMPGGNTSDSTYRHEYYERHIDRTNNSEVKIRLVHNVTTYNASHDVFLDYVEMSCINVITAADIADAVWDEPNIDHLDDGSTGKALSTASSGGIDYGLLADAVWNDNVTNRVTANSAGLAMFQILSEVTNEARVVDNGDDTKTVTIFTSAGSPNVYKSYTISIVGDTETKTNI